MTCSCGPFWLPSFILRWYLKVPAGQTCFFHEACLEHDQDYDSGMPRDEADLKFLIHMLKLAVIKETTHTEVFRATSFFRWVRYFGWISYYRQALLRKLKGNNNVAT